MPPSQPDEPMPASLKDWMLGNAEHDIRVQDMIMRARASFGLEDGHIGRFVERADLQLLAEMHDLRKHVEQLPVEKEAQ